jgi:hypothetical protein
MNGRRPASLSHSATERDRGLPHTPRRMDDPHLARAASGASYRVIPKDGPGAEAGPVPTPLTAVTVNV